jgi:hypothetical protein
MSTAKNKALIRRYFEEALHGFWYTTVRLVNDKLAEGWALFGQLWLRPQRSVAPARVEYQATANKVDVDQDPGRL